METVNQLTKSQYQNVHIKSHQHPNTLELLSYKKEL